MEEDGAAVFELTVAEDDFGKVIGKQGRTARALRTILSRRLRRCEPAPSLKSSSEQQSTSASCSRATACAAWCGCAPRADLAVVDRPVALDERAIRVRLRLTRQGRLAGDPDGVSRPRGGRGAARHAPSRLLGAAIPVGRRRAVGAGSHRLSASIDAGRHHARRGQRQLRLRGARGARGRAPPTAASSCCRSSTPSSPAVDLDDAHHHLRSAARARWISTKRADRVESDGHDLRRRHPVSRHVRARFWRRACSARRWRRARSPCTSTDPRDFTMTSTTRSTTRPTAAAPAW